MVSATPPPIAADVHEGQVVVRELVELGACVFIRALAAGDYDLGNGVLVERKAVRDLHLSIVEGRFWSQLGRLRSHSRRPYLLVEGHDLDAGPLSPAAVRGVILAAAEQGVLTLRSKDPRDSASWLIRAALRGIRTFRAPDRPLYAQRPKARSAQTAAEAMLAAIPGISSITARSLLAHFGTAEAVFRAAPQELLAVPGLGPVRAERLADTLTHSHSLYRSRLRRERLGPST